MAEEDKDERLKHAFDSENTFMGLAVAILCRIVAQKTAEIATP